MVRRLKTYSYRPDNISKDDFSVDLLRTAGIVVFGCPREKFTVTEMDMLKKYVKAGGSLLFMLGEGGEDRAGTNINYLLEQFGMTVNPDAVLRTTHYKYLHPKEVLISDGILNSEVIKGAGKTIGGSHDDDLDFKSAKGMQAFDGTGLDFVYPYGSTVSVQKPAIPILSSGKVAYPMNRPLGAVWAQAGFGKIAVLGSVLMWDDKWIDKEENSKLMEFMFKFLKPVSTMPAVSDVSLQWTHAYIHAYDYVQLS